MRNICASLKSLVVLTIIVLAFVISTGSVSAQDSSVPVEEINLNNLIAAYIIQNGVDIIANNIKAAERETGEIDKAIRAVLGVSIKDIRKHGLLGGKNSEMRKLFKALGLPADI